VPDYGFDQGLWLAIFIALILGIMPVLVCLRIIWLSVIHFIKPRGYWTDYFGGIGYQVILEMYLWVMMPSAKTGANYISLNFKVAT